MASGTHPTAAWRDMQQSSSERYDTVMHDLQMIGQRNMLCGMHVHVELPDPDERIDVMTRMLPYLPLFVALATSSPFWHSRPTGLKGYRLAAYDELPRTGVPELFRTKEEFDAYVAALVRAGVMEDASFVWWAIRPSLEHPTLELRAPDCCTLVEDSIAIAALYRVLARHLTRNPLLNHDVDAVARAIVVENKWRAQRYGVRGTFVGDYGAIGVGELLDQLIEEIAPDAEALGCLPELRCCRAIVGAGTSAGHPAGGVRGARPRREPRACAAGGDRLDRGRHLAMRRSGADEQADEFSHALRFALEPFQENDRPRQRVRPEAGPVDKLRRGWSPVFRPKKRQCKNVGLDCRRELDRPTTRRCDGRRLHGGRAGERAHGRSDGLPGGDEPARCRRPRHHHRGPGR